MTTKYVLYITPRVEQRCCKTLQVLSQMGYEIVVLCADISGIFKNKLPDNICWHKFKFLLNPSLVYDPLLYFSVIHQLKSFRQYRFELVLFQDVILFGAFVNKIKSFLHYKALAVDILDNYEFVADDIYADNFLRRYLLKKATYSGYDKLKYCDAVLVVCDANKTRIARDYNVDIKKIHLLENLPILPINGFLPAKTKQFNSIVYLGRIDERIRDLATVIRALVGTDWCLHIYAVNYDSLDCKNLQLLVENLELQRQVRFLKPVPVEQSLDVLRGYGLGIIPHRDIKTTQYTLPNKLYDYIVAGLPVLVSNVRILADYVSKWDIGWVYNDINSLNLLLKSDSVASLYNDKQISCAKMRSKLDWRALAMRVLGDLL